MYKPGLRLAIAMSCLTMSTSYAQINTASTASAAAASVNMKVQIVSASQMARQDADLLTTHRRDMVAAAELNGYDIDSGSWIQNQVICPEAQNHLIMHYLKISGDGMVSLFTAIIPREHGQVRIIPVLYHGVQASHMFGSSPGQRELINEVISTRTISATPGPDSDWASLAYCYAALAGAEPTSTSVTSPEETIPRLVVSADGKVREMSFSVVGPDHLFQDWTILFDRQTQVKSIALSARAINMPQAVQERRLKSHPIPAPE